MALFSSKKRTEGTAVSAPAAGAPRTDLSWVLLKPRITEKATDVGAVRAYVFNVSGKANKRQIAQAVALVYKVTPVKVRVTPVHSKNVRNARTGMPGVKSGGKKAYVYLKEGDTINLV